MPKVGDSDCRSLCSTQHSSGRLPKVSIGITVGNHAKVGSGPGKEGGAESLSKQRVSSFQENIVEGNTQLGISKHLEFKQAEAKDQKVGEWPSTKSVLLETLNTDADKFNRFQTSIQQPEGGVYKKSDAGCYESRREQDGNHDKVEQVTCSGTIQEMSAMEKSPGEKAQKIPSCSNEVLKMKLCAILGTAPSQTKQSMDLPNPVENAGNLSMKQNLDYQRFEGVKPRPNSDPIETDSESPKQAMRRPQTRSLSRKSAPTKTTGTKFKCETGSVKKPLPSCSAEYSMKLEKNIFTFDEGERNAGKREQTINVNSSMLNSKKKERRKLPIEPRRIYFSRRSNSEKSLKKSGREQISSTLEKLPSQSKNTPTLPRLPCHRTKGSTHTLKEVPKGSHSSCAISRKHVDSPSLAKNADYDENAENQPPKKRKHPRECFKSPPTPEDDCSHKYVLKSPSLLANNTDAEDDFQSPPLAKNASFHSEKTQQLDEGLCTRPVNASETVENRRLFSTGRFNNLRSGLCGSDVHIESSDDTREINGVSDGEFSPLMKEKQVEEQLSLSLLEERDTERFEADDHMNKGFRGRENTFSNDGSPFILRHSKRAYNLEDIRLSKISLPSPTFIGTSRTEDTSQHHEPPEQCPDNALERGVLHLAFVLERFKTKMKSNTQRKSSEIVLSVSERISQQLQDAESQIQEDVRKIIIVGKSKRKRLESRFQEQHDKLRLIHDKFKEEFNQHLLGCRSSLEELEAYQTELEESVVRQKALHKKLLIQLDESTKAQLSEAETNVAAIHKEAKKKMNCLKHALKEWVGEGDFS